MEWFRQAALRNQQQMKDLKELKVLINHVDVQSKKYSRQKKNQCKILKYYPTCLDR